jgi:hypothetical protein
VGDGINEKETRTQFSFTHYMTTIYFVSDRGVRLRLALKELHFSLTLCHLQSKYKERVYRHILYCSRCTFKRYSGVGHISKTLDTLFPSLSHFT